MANESGRIMRDAIMNCGGGAASVVAGLILVPLFVIHLGPRLYGLWLAVLAIAEMATFINAGLAKTVSYRVASEASRREGELSDFLDAAASGFLLLGLAGAAYIIIAGFGLNTQLHLSAAERKTGMYVVLLTASSFAALQVTAFSSEVLTGLRRFDLVNTIAAAHTLTRAAGTVLILLLWPSLVVLAIWSVLCAIASAVLARVFVRRLRPAWRISARLHRLGAVWPYLGFGGTSQLASVSSWLISGAPTVLIGMLGGAAAIVPFEIGRKIPAAMEAFNWNASSPIYPASSAFAADDDPSRAKEVLKAGTGTLIKLVFPLVISLWWVAPQLLHVWVRGWSSPEAARILRVLLVWIAVDALTASSFQFLWGRGKARTVLGLTTLGGTVCAVATMAMLPTFGVTGAAIGILLGASVAGAGAIRIAGKMCRLGASELLRHSFQGAWAALAAAALVATAVSRSTVTTWPGVAAAIASPVAAFLVTLLAVRRNVEERALARRAFRVIRFYVHAVAHGES